MTKITGNKKGKLEEELKSEEDTLKTFNESLNTPVDKQTNSHSPTEEEKATYKKAENPLGDPDKE